MNTIIRVSGLYCYPVKSCRGISLQGAVIGRMGIHYDRQWMVVDENGMFVAQRASGGLGVPVKSLCRIETSFLSDWDLVLSAPEMPQLSIPLHGVEGETVPIQVWESTGEGVDQGHEAQEWLTTFLSRERAGVYRLVRMSDDGVRKTKSGESELAFADAYPFLVVSQESLDDLNARMPEPLPMDRFRPNIVLSGGNPYEEDLMERFVTGGVEFSGAKHCVRCAITTTNQHTGERGKEPLTTLATYRKTPKGVIFGRNFDHHGIGIIRVGDKVEVLAHNEAPVFAP